MFEIGLMEPTKELLLEYYSEEHYMSYYLEIPVSKNLFCSPLRIDKNPTCSFFRTTNGVLKMKDFATGISYDFVNVVMEKFKVDYYKALKIIANDFDIIPNPRLTKNISIVQDIQHIDVVEKTTKIQIKRVPFEKNDLFWWNQFGITPATLEKFFVFRAEHVFLNGRLHSTYQKYDPSYAYYFGIVDGEEKWKIYYPLRKKNRFLMNCSFIQGMRQLPASGNILVVTKSLKDVMSLYELEIAAIAPQAESVIMKESEINPLKPFFKYIVFNGDWDVAGKKFMIQNRKLHGGLCLYFKEKDKTGKDISDFIKKFGIEEARKLTENLIQQCKLY